VQTNSLAKASSRPAWIRRTRATVIIVALARSAPPSCAGVSSDHILTLMPAAERTSWAEELRLASALPYPTSLSIKTIAT
jgi:hypothetical protein